MPTFTTIAWETLLEPRIRDSCDNKKQVPGDEVVGGENNGEKKSVQPPRHVYISPALYATPEPTPIPDTSSDLISPSPYVVNHKRRGGEGFGRRGGGFDEVSLQKSDGGERDLDSDGDGDNVAEEVVVDNFWGAEIASGDCNGDCVVQDDFFNPRCDSVSVDGLTDVRDCGKQDHSRSYASNQGEFFDASEDFSSDGSSSKLTSSRPRIESELHAAKLILIEEIERRKAAEHAVDEMYNQWQRLGNLLSQAGLTFPTPPNATSMQREINSSEQFSQELTVIRFVAAALGRGQARAEAEIAAEAINESKDKEISRLRDRLLYYETVNREMSQRNQEIMEAARKQRERKKIQRKWLWGCIGLTVIIGTSVIAYSYLPQMSKPDALPSSGDPSDASSITYPESG